MKCPCHSGKDYEMCCEPYHNGEAPPTAVELMRSRYAAYALGKVEYILETTHPDLSQPVRAGIEAFSKETEFRNLEILAFEAGEPTSYVTFRATLFQHGKDVSFTEKSTFTQVNGRWLYRAAELS